MNSKLGISGSLKFITFGDLMQLVGTNGSTGILSIRNKYADNPGQVYFLEGKMIDAVAGELTGIKALYTLFGWVDGEFEFIVDKVNRESVIKEGRMEIILNGLSMLDDGITKKLGPVQHDETSSTDKNKINLPVIKGPLVDYMYVVDEDTYYDASSIVEQGKHGGWIWVILEGIVEIRKQTPKGPLTILRLGAGAFIGSISTFLMKGAARSATAIAIGEVQLGVLDGQLLSKEYSILTGKAKEIVLSLDKRLKLITNSIVDKPDDKSPPRLFDKNDLVKLNWDDYKEKIHIITKGEIHFVINTARGLVPFIILQEDDFFGEILSIDFRHIAKDIVFYSTTELQTNEMELDRFQQDFDRMSTTFNNIVDNIVSCISITTNIALKRLRGAPNNKKQVNNKQ